MCENLIPETDAGHLRQAACNIYQATCHMVETTEVQTRPSFIYRDQLQIYPDGNAWCVLWGEDIQTGICGFGDSPAEAMKDFDDHWHGKLHEMETYWYCPHCEGEINPMSVTYEETHQQCGYSVEIRSRVKAVQKDSAKGN